MILLNFILQKNFFDQIMNIFEKDIDFNYSSINIDKSKEHF